MAIKSRERVTGCFANAAEDEPLFVLRAQDKLSSEVVRFWAKLAAEAGVNPAKVNEAHSLAAQMDKWPKRKTPD